MYSGQNSSIFFIYASNMCTVRRYYYFCMSHRKKNCKDLHWEQTPEENQETHVTSLKYCFLRYYFVEQSQFLVIISVTVCPQQGAVSLYSPRCPGTHYVDQASIKLRHIHLPLLLHPVIKGMHHYYCQELFVGFAQLFFQRKHF